MRCFDLTDHFTIRSGAFARNYPKDQITQRFVLCLISIQNISIAKGSNVISKTAIFRAHQLKKKKKDLVCEQKHGFPSGHSFII